MKKVGIMIFCLIFLFLFPVDILAKSYSLNGTDITIDIPDDWYVFTRDNIKNNADMVKLQIDYEYMKNFFEQNYAYMDTFIMYDNGQSVELFVRVKENNNINNLSNYSDDNVLELAESLAKKTGSNDYDVYVEDYKYAVSKYIDNGMYIIEYYTIVNGYGYTMTIQKPAMYTADEEAEIKQIIDSIVFDVDESLEESYKEKSIWDSIFNGAIDGAVTGIFVGGIIGGVSGLIIFLKKKKNKISEDGK